MKLPIFAGALAIVAATSAFAGEPTNPTTAMDPTATFKSLDTDGNGTISATEARGHDALNAGYRDAVSDADKGMSMAEFEAWAASQKSGAMTPNSSSTTPTEVPPSN